MTNEALIVYSFYVCQSVLPPNSWSGEQEGLSSSQVLLFLCPQQTLTVFLSFIEQLFLSQISMLIPTLHLLLLLIQWFGPFTDITVFFLSFHIVIYVKLYHESLSPAC